MAIELINKEYVNTEVISVLEDLLKRAKTGELIGVAVALVNNNGSSGNVFTERYPVNMLGSLTVLQKELMDICIDTRLHRAGVEM